MKKSSLRHDLKDRIKQGGMGYSPLYSCTWCERLLDPPGTQSQTEATKDHPHPKSKGGGGVTVWCCWACNQIKYDMPYEAWKLYMEMHPQWWEMYHSRTSARAFKKTKEEGSVIPFKRKEMIERFPIITGGLPPSSGNWLMDLPIHSRFTVKKRADMSDPRAIKNFMGLDLEMVAKTSKTCIIYEMSTGAPFGGNGRIIPERFTQEFDLVEILPSYEEQMEALEETSHGDSHRTDQPVSE